MDGTIYEAPAVIDLGTVAELTLGTCLGTDDGTLGATSSPAISGLCA